MALTVSSDDPFKSLNRLNTVPITTAGNTHQAIPIKKFFSFSPWTVQKEECFYDEKTVHILETGHTLYRLLQIAFTISFISIPILFRSAINLYWRKAILAFELLVISFLSISKLGISIQCSENITSHLDSIKNELIALRKQALVTLASEIPPVSSIAALKEVQINFDSRKGMMIRSFSYHIDVKENSSLTNLLSQSLHNDFTMMESLAPLFNEEGQGEEEKEIVSVLKRLCKEDGASLKQTFTDLSLKTENKVLEKFTTLIKHGLPLETSQKEALHLMQNLDKIDQFINLLQKNLEADSPELHIFSNLLDVLQHFTSLDPTDKIPDGILKFSQDLQKICEDKTLSFELEPWLIDDTNIIQISKADKIKTLSLSCLQNPAKMQATSFWKQELPGLFIGLNLYLERQPDHYLAKEVILLLEKFKKLEIAPDLFCTHAYTLTELIDLFSDKELVEFHYYYRIFILREKCGFYLDKYSGLS